MRKLLAAPEAAQDPPPDEASQVPVPADSESVPSLPKTPIKARRTVKIAKNVLEILTKATMVERNKVYIRLRYIFDVVPDHGREAVLFSSVEPKRTEGWIWGYFWIEGDRNSGATAMGPRNASLIDFSGGITIPVHDSRLYAIEALGKT